MDSSPSCWRSMNKVSSIQFISCFFPRCTVQPFTPPRLIDQLSVKTTHCFQPLGRWKRQHFCVTHISDQSQKLVFLSHLGPQKESKFCPLNELRTSSDNFHSGAVIRAGEALVPASLWLSSGAAAKRIGSSPTRHLHHDWVQPPPTYEL